MFHIDNSLRKASMPRTVRFTEKLFADLNATADEYDISFNLLVLQCCQYALQHMEKEETQDKGV